MYNKRGRKSILSGENQGAKGCHKSGFRVNSLGMDEAEIQRIREYVTELEEGLHKWDYRGMTTLGYTTELHRIIESLMRATFEAKEKETKVVLASLEYRARRCKECIERRLAVRN